MKHNYYHNIGRFIGYYYGVSPVLSKYPEGDAGDYFLNGETCSLWMWDAASATWIDTNRVDIGLQQMLTDEEGNSPSDYVPSPSVGIKEAYFYVAENADCDCLSLASEIRAKLLLTLDQVDKQLLGDSAALSGEADREIPDSQAALLIVVVPVSAVAGHITAGEEIIRRDLSALIGPESPGDTGD